MTKKLLILLVLISAPITLFADQGHGIVSIKDFGAVGDGVANDTKAIQLAINSRSSGSVYFPPGTYKTGSTIHLKSDVSVIGNQATITYSSPMSNGGSFFSIGSSSAMSNIEISGIRFDGKGTWSSVPFANPYGRGNSVGFSNNQHGIYVARGSSNIRIHDCDFTGLKHGIFTDDAHQCQLVNNHFHGMGMSAISLRKTDYTVISNNIIRGILGNLTEPGVTSTESSCFADGIYIHSSQHLTVSNNVIENCIRMGIVIESNEKVSLCSGVTISGNSIHNMNSCRGGEINSAIWVESGRADGTVIITGNTCDNTNAVSGSAKSIGINSCHATSVGNVVRGFTQCGIYGREMNVFANKIEFNGVGVELSWHPLASSLTCIKNNVISDNRLSGILIENRRGTFIIQGNIIRDNGLFGTSTIHKCGVAIVKFLPDQTTCIRDNVFISSANQGASVGQIYSIYGDSGWRANYAPTNVINNHFSFTGTFSSSYPNNLSVAPCSFACSPFSDTNNLTLSEIGPDNGQLNINNKFPRSGTSITNAGYLVFRGYASVPPTTGTYRKGDYLLNNNVTAGSCLGWICITTGSPGTWKTYGSISN